MSKTKQKWSKKKKIIVIILCVVLFLLVAIIGTGLGVLKWYCTPVDYTITPSSSVATADTKLIAHRGFRAAAPENTLPAFKLAGERGFWGAECDVYRTKDGVWVIHHDSNTFRMMNTTKSVEKMTYDELLKYDTDNGNNIENYPDLKICTFEEYMQVCQDYGMNAVIELKSKNNTEHYDELVHILERFKCDVTIISFHEDDLKAFRELSDVPMFYLCQDVDDEALEIAKSIGNCGIDFNYSDDDNYEDDSEYLKQAQLQGLPLGAWTVDDLDSMQKLVDLGIEYITTDCIVY